MSDQALRDKELSYDGLDVKIIGYNVGEDPFGEM